MQQHLRDGPDQVGGESGRFGHVAHPTPFAGCVHEERRTCACSARSRRSKPLPARRSAPPTGSRSPRSGSTSSPRRPTTHQWIHVDQEKAKAGPFGGTIAHGYLTLSLIPWLGNQVFGVETEGAKLNYGLNKVRFPNPVPVGARVRAMVTVGEIAEIPAGRQLTMKYVIEIEGQDKPACVAETVVLLLS